MSLKKKMYKIPDFSFWQDDPTTTQVIDFTQTRQKTRGVILRCGQGSWEDRAYKTNRNNARAAGMITGNYFYYDNRYHPKRQAEKWASIIDDNDKLGAWLDLEQDMAGEFKTYKHWYDCVQYFKQLKPEVELGIYTRASYFNDPAFSIPVNHSFRFMPLWVAHYNQSVTRPDMPKGWTTWDFWQWTDDYPSEGWGVESEEIDMNFFNGTEQEFIIRYGLGNPPTPPAVQSTLDADFNGVRATYNQE